MNKKSIQILRGNRSTIADSSDTLLPGQPLYIKDENYLTIGGGQLTKQPITTNKVKGYFADRETIQQTKSESDSYYFGPSSDGTKLNIESSQPIKIAKKPSEIVMYNNGLSDVTLLDLLHPVWSIFETTDANLSTTQAMADFFGGTWEVFGEGRVIVGAGSYTDKNNLTYSFPIDQVDTGEYTHTLSEDELAYHTHETYTYDSGAHSHDASISESGAHSHTLEQDVDYPNDYDRYKPLMIQSDWDKGIHQYWHTNTDGAHTHPIEVNENGTHNHQIHGSGNNIPHNNLQPYIVVYRYRRIPDTI